jgi:hypothetical protein
VSVREGKQVETVASLEEVGSNAVKFVRKAVLCVVFEELLDIFVVRFWEALFTPEVPNTRIKVINCE